VSSLSFDVEDDARAGDVVRLVARVVDAFVERMRACVVDTDKEDNVNIMICQQLKVASSQTHAQTPLVRWVDPTPDDRRID